MDEGRVVIELVPADGADVELELFAADQRRDLLEEVLGVPVVLRPATVVRSG